MSDFALTPGAVRRSKGSAVGEGVVLRAILIAVAVGFLGLFLLLPLAVVFFEAFAHGLRGYIGTFFDPDVQAAVRLTLLVAAIVVPLNTAFGLCAAWWIAKFDFRGKEILVTLIDLPFSVSPVVSGLIFVLVFGAQGVLGPWAAAHGLHVIFAVPGIVLATLFVTFPFVAREVIRSCRARERPRRKRRSLLAQAASKRSDRHAAKYPMGALVRRPALQRARDGRIRGRFRRFRPHPQHDQSIPLQVEILYNEYNIASAFTLATLLALLALVTLGFKTALEWRTRQSGS